MKIYVIGTVGSGKSTLSKKLANYYNINYYELDNVIWEYNPNGDIRRDNEDIKKIFNDILSNDNYIMEDVGRDIFKQGIIDSDIVIYYNLNKFTLYKQLIKRYLRQKLGVEYSSYKPSIKMLINMFKWVNKDINNSKLNYIKDNCSKIIVINKNTSNTFNKVIESIDSYEKI